MITDTKYNFGLFNEGTASLGIKIRSTLPFGHIDRNPRISQVEGLGVIMLAFFLEPIKMGRIKKTFQIPFLLLRRGEVGQPDKTS